MSIRVLVVDDTDHVRAMLVDMLELDGFEVAAAASSGREAIELATATKPDVIVMDYRMPDMDGLTSARDIRGRVPEMPIILYTAYLDDDLRLKAKAAGITVCVGKVEGMQELERHISQLCRDLTGRR